MERLLWITALLLAAAPAGAHPSVSVAMDSRSNIYYSDLKQVWKIAPDGKKSVAVPNVHTHELYVDAEDNLYGEHLWYEGEATDEWGHYVWRLAADGKLTRIIPPRQGFRDDYRDFSFVRDRAGNMYWALREAKPIVIRRVARDGKVSDLGADAGLSDGRTQRRPVAAGVRRPSRGARPAPPSRRDGNNPLGGDCAREPGFDFFEAGDSSAALDLILNHHAGRQQHLAAGELHRIGDVHDFSIELKLAQSPADNFFGGAAAGAAGAKDFDLHGCSSYEK